MYSLYAYNNGLFTKIADGMTRPERREMLRKARDNRRSSDKHYLILTYRGTEFHSSC